MSITVKRQDGTIGTVQTASPKAKAQTPAQGKTFAFNANKPAASNNYYGSKGADTLVFDKAFRDYKFDANGLSSPGAKNAGKVRVKDASGKLLGDVDAIATFKFSDGAYRVDNKGNLVKIADPNQPVSETQISKDGSVAHSEAKVTKDGVESSAAALSGPNGSRTEALTVESDKKGNTAITNVEAQAGKARSDSFAANKNSSSLVKAQTSGGKISGSDSQAIADVNGTAAAAKAFDEKKSVSGTAVTDGAAQQTQAQATSEKGTSNSTAMKLPLGTWGTLDLSFSSAVRNQDAAADSKAGDANLAASTNGGAEKGGTEASGKVSDKGVMTSGWSGKAYTDAGANSEGAMASVYSGDKKVAEFKGDKDAAAVGIGGNLFGFDLGRIGKAFSPSEAKQKLAEANSPGGTTPAVSKQAPSVALAQKEAVAEAEAKQQSIIEAARDNKGKLIDLIKSTDTKDLSDAQLATLKGAAWRLKGDPTIMGSLTEKEKLALSKFVGSDKQTRDSALKSELGFDGLAAIEQKAQSDLGSRAGEIKKRDLSQFDPRTLSGAKDALTKLQSYAPDALLPWDRGEKPTPIEQKALEELTGKSASYYSSGSTQDIRQAWIDHITSALSPKSKAPVGSSFNESVNPIVYQTGALFEAPKKTGWQLFQ